jgi:hypothetical protein
MKQLSEFYGSILITAYSRPQELARCLESVTNQIGDVSYPIVVFRQKGNSEVSEVISRFLERISYLVEFNALGKTPLENINLNRILGYEFCFNILKSKWVLAIEEDIEISNDSVRFVEAMYLRYAKKKSFRGVNLGSMEPLQDNLKSTYSLLRYGLHGQAAAICDKTWQKFKVPQLIERSKTHALDGQLEFYLKSGFMVTPNNSRYVDWGWNGTHAPKDASHTYYSQLRQSWVGKEVELNSAYSRMDIRHAWRSDCKPYRRFSLYFYLEMAMGFIRRIKKVIISYQ